MKKVISIIALLAMTGCAGGTTTITRTTTDTLTGQVVVTEEQQPAPSIFKSENLEMYYNNDNQRVASHQLVAVTQVNGILANGARRVYSTPTEATLGSVIDSLLIAQVRASAPPSTSPAPKTAIDLFERNIIPLAYLGVGILGAAFDWDIGGPFGGSNGGDGSTSLREVTIAGDFYNQSERNDQYYLEEGSAWGGTESPNLSWTYETNTGNASGESSSSSVPSDDNTSLF